ncbi:MAG: hypothetical protein WC708_19250, partial [Lentisphaeria bacterium]
TVPGTIARTEMLGPPFWERVFPKPLPKTFVPFCGFRRPLLLPQSWIVALERPAKSAKAIKGFGQEFFWGPLSLKIGFQYGPPGERDTGNRACTNVKQAILPALVLADPPFSV